MWAERSFGPSAQAHQEKDAKADAEEVKPGAVPAYLLDREQVRRTKVLSNMIKQKRKELEEVGAVEKAIRF